MQQQHLISVLMENEAGSLSRLVGLFSQRGYNIETLNVAPTEDRSIDLRSLELGIATDTLLAICALRIRVSISPTVSCILI